MRATMLTDEEINLIRDGFAHIPCQDTNFCNEPDVFAAVESIVTARVSATLREAADEFEEFAGVDVGTDRVGPSQPRRDSTSGRWHPPQPSRLLRPHRHNRRERMMSDQFCPHCGVSNDLHDGPDSCARAESKAQLIEMFGVIR